MNAQQVAIALQAWAQENHLLQTDFPVVLDENDVAKDALFDSLQISGMSESILRKRVMTAIAFNDSINEVIVFTARATTLAEQKVLPKAIQQKVSIRYVHGGVAQAGVPNNGGVQAPYFLLNGKYTCGSSIHPARVIGAGTLGCLVTDEAGQIFGLTNNHVSGMCNYSHQGEKILAPGHVDITAGGMDPYTLGYHHSALPMTPGVPDNINISANLDAALIMIADRDSVSSMQAGIYDTPSKCFELQPGQQVEKIGRTTGHRCGTVVGQMIGAYPVTYNVPGHGSQVTFFEPVMAVQGTDGNIFSEPGDSGSLVTTILNGERYAVGLLFAGDNQGLTYVLPLSRILTTFNVTLLSGHNI
ncbi:hypothetical protein [Collimonas pratensis]|uniref:Trypsin family protein n=1 Tax=Collimonas pratensis TaxID=279113 RepID=A0ABM5YZQ5_9BURK|nr:hypothetical protein [Collimonas pratensis]AMP12307.1 hypothetical protein CPter291_0011 [Collimonas pratensis]